VPREESVWGGGRKKGGGWEKCKKITKYCIILSNRNSANRWKPTKKERELTLKGAEAGRFELPCPLHMILDPQ